MEKAKAKKLALVILVILLFLAFYLVGKYGIGCEINGRVVVCGSKDGRLDGCYVE